MSLRPETLKKYVELARPILIEVAKRENTITYKNLMEKMGGPGRGYIGEILEEICQRERDEKRPLLSALVVHSNDQLPGYAFWKLSFMPEGIRNGTKEAKRKFWKQQRSEVWKKWK